MSEKMDLNSMVVKESEEQKKPIDMSLVVQSLDEKINLRVSSKTKSNLDELAKKYNCSLSEVVRQLAEQGIEIVKRQK